MSASYETRIAKSIRAKLEFDMERVKLLLSSGGLLNSSVDPGMIGIQCAKWMGHAGALQFAMDCIDLAEEEMFGREKEKKENIA